VDLHFVFLESFEQRPTGPSSMPLGISLRTAAFAWSILSKGLGLRRTAREQEELFYSLNFLPLNFPIIRDDY
jgi:hypothetical protein